MLFLSDMHNTSSAEFYDAVCIAHSLGYNMAFKQKYFQELPEILEKRFSSCHNKKVQANNTCGILDEFLGIVLSYFILNLSERFSIMGC